MLVGTAEFGLVLGHGEVQTQLPECIAGRFVFERVHLGVIERIEQQVAFGTQPVESGERAGNNAERLAVLQNAVPDGGGVGRLAEDLVTALAGIAGA